MDNIHHPQRTKGFILIVTLLFLGVFTLLVLTLLKDAELTQKMAAQFWEKIQAFELAESLLLQKIPQKFEHPQDFFISAEGNYFNARVNLIAHYQYNKRLHRSSWCEMAIGLGC